MTTTLPVYDSAQPRTTLVSVFTNLWAYRGLLKLLVRRELTVRYKRSTLGVWWTLLNPLLTTAVLWLVFGVIAGRFGNADLAEPYVVYLLAGVIMMTFFSQTVLATGSAITGSKDILSKVYVPAEVFAFSTAFAGLVNFLISSVLLMFAALVSGQGIAWTAMLSPLPVLSITQMLKWAVVPPPFVPTGREEEWRFAPMDALAAFMSPDSQAGTVTATAGDHENESQRQQAGQRAPHRHVE